METIKEIFDFFKGIGLEDHVIVLSLVQGALMYFMQKFYKQLKAHQKVVSDYILTSTKALKHLKEEHDKLNEKTATTDIWRESIKEKLDSLEDHCKEIKKAQLYR